MKSFKENEEGFTLVELMVVVAIIGILSAVAIPNFRSYQAKTKTSEAKLQLAAMYSAMASLEADFDSYGTCLTDAGYLAPTANNYYATGFSAEVDAANGIVRNNGGSCVTGAATANFQFPGQKSVGGVVSAVNFLASIDFSGAGVTFNVGTIAGTAPTVSADGSSFVAGAAGVVSPTFNAAATASQWVINQNKDLREINRGY